MPQFCTGFKMKRFFHHILNFSGGSTTFGFFFAKETKIELFSVFRSFSEFRVFHSGT